MPDIPRDKYDDTLALFSEGYNFIRNRCARYHTDIFATRLLLKPVICTLGEDAAKMFYHPGRFARSAAMPSTNLMLRQNGSVQVTQGTVHTQRKHIFLTGDNIGRMATAMQEEWRQRLSQWEQKDELVLHRELREILSYASYRWAGIPLNAEEAQQRTRELGAMIDGAGSLGPKSWWALLLRTRAEHWAQALIEDVRAHRREIRPATPLYRLAWYRENGELLSKKAAAIELLNLLRPIVAVAHYLTFAALALHDHPQYKERLRFGHRKYLHFFVQEVRRFYPFLPFVGGRVQIPFDWRGYHFAEGAWVLLDLYGTNHDERIWWNPDQFEPERFRTWNGSAYNFIPQGGGNLDDGHRCPGERMTIELLKTGVELLVNDMRYQVPEQDLSIDMSTMPTLPRSGFILRQVRRMTSAPPPGPTAKICPFPEHRNLRR
jgi:fatty-acid peroxygenase